MTQALTPLSTHHLLARVTWFYDKLFLRNINFHRLCVWTTTQHWNHLLHFLYAALFVDIIYLGLCRSKKVFVYDIAERSWEIV